MSANFNNNYSRYYDLLYKDKDYAAEADYVVSLIGSLHANASTFLELGSGTGNHAAILCQQGYQVTGMERSEDMLAIANAKSIAGFKSMPGDIIHFELDQKFDVAISLFHVISYLQHNEALVSCFNSVHNHLNPKGLFIFDVWYTPAVNFQQPTTRVKRMEDDVIKVTRFAEPEIHANENIVDVNYEIIIQNKSNGLAETYHEKHPMRHFCIPEIDLLAKLTGFDLIKTEEFQTGRLPGIDTWGICFILQKI